MFVHFLNGKTICFQDDHKLLEEIESFDLEKQPFERIFIEHRRVKIPASTSPEEYTITIGLYHMKINERLRPKTALVEDRREVTLPVVLKTVKQ